MRENQKSNNPKQEKISEKEVIEFIFDRFKETKEKNKIKHLVSFQSMNKYMIMAHDQNELKILGNIVATNKKNQFTEIFIEYEKHLKIALRKNPTTKTHSNVILHIFGYFSKKINQIEKDQFFNLLKQFNEKKIRVGEILSEINTMVYRFDTTYLASQTYFLLYSDANPNNLFESLNKN